MLKDSHDETSVIGWQFSCGGCVGGGDAPTKPGIFVASKDDASDEVSVENSLLFAFISGNTNEAQRLMQRGLEWTENDNAKKMTQTKNRHGPWPRKLYSPARIIAFAKQQQYQTDIKTHIVQPVTFQVAEEQKVADPDAPALGVIKEGGLPPTIVKKEVHWPPELEVQKSKEGTEPDQEIGMMTHETSPLALTVLRVVLLLLFSVHGGLYYMLWLHEKTCQP